MTFRQFAFNNVARNKRIYLGHFLSSTFAVMIFFIYGLLAFHPSILQGNLSDVSQTMDTFGRIGFQVSQYITYFFSIFFVLYSVSSFLKKRKIEFGILTVVGLSPRQLNKLIFIENMIIGFASIITGMTLGVILSKLILLVSASILAIEKSLPYYFPVKAIVMTGIAFSILFLLVSFFISKTVKVSELVDLIKSKAKPLPEPKSSVWLAVLSVFLIGVGYCCVFYFGGDARHHLTGNQLTALLVFGVGFVVLGTYYLFTQLSVYVLKTMRRKASIYFKKTNLLTLSELTYRMKDNAKTFFLVAIISTAAFVAIGTSSAIGDALKAEIGSPFAILYQSYNENELESKHISEITKQLDQSEFDYLHITSTYTWLALEDKMHNIYAMRLSEYNQAAKQLGYTLQSLENENDAFVINSLKVIENHPPLDRSEQYIKYDLDGEIKDSGPLQITKTIDNPYLGQQYNKILVVHDALFEKVSTTMSQMGNDTINGFVIDNWQDTLELSQEIDARINDADFNSSFSVSFLSIQWQQMKELNGILSILTVLVGIVFFVFACSFLYFRLFTDLDKDQEQYQMLSKIGLSIKELKKVVTRQMALLFFLPMSVAIIHSGIAFTALQILGQSEFSGFSVVQSSIVVLTSFLGLKIVYFLVIRRNYLQQLYRSIA